MVMVMIMTTIMATAIVRVVFGPLLNIMSVYMGLAG